MILCFDDFFNLKNAERTTIASSNGAWFRYIWKMPRCLLLEISASDHLYERPKKLEHNCAQAFSHSLHRNPHAKDAAYTLLTLYFDRPLCGIYKVLRDG